MSEKLCLFCEHLYLCNGSPGYSEYTPGTDFDMFCKKQHWTFDSCNTSEGELALILTTATTCEDYRLKQSIVDYVNEQRGNK